MGKLKKPRKKTGLHGVYTNEFGVITRYHEGILHCDDGPAIETDTGIKKWLQNGVFHRLDGPAIVYTLGTAFEKSAEWWWFGECMGSGKSGFWKFWDKLTPQQQNNLELHQWLVKYSTKYA